ncbi:MAG: hypothetical protein GXP27_07825 [Planctomycetes bacterium]|nr:hypothetical protein [Planctomycetota bacterium]
MSREVTNASRAKRSQPFRRCLRTKPESSAASRRGVALLVAMICVALVSAVAASLLRCALVQFQQTRARQRQLQTIWLVESGANRAAARLAADPNYKGETWKPMPLGYSPESMNATVTITVRTADGKPEWRSVEVLAIHPVDRKHRSRVRKTFQVRLPQKAGDQS